MYPNVKVRERERGKFNRKWKKIQIARCRYQVGSGKIQSWGGGKVRDLEGRGT